LIDAALAFNSALVKNCSNVVADLESWIISDSEYPLSQLITRSNSFSVRPFEVWIDGSHFVDFSSVMMIQLLIKLITIL